MLNKETAKTRNAMLLERAAAARVYAYAPYSGFKVGAALLCKDGTIYTGCNIENAAYGPSNCAERTAIFKAVSEGHRDFEAIAIVGGRDDVEKPCTPCGVCRQVMLEFCGEAFEIILHGSKGEPLVYRLGTLMPLGFDLKGL